MLPSMILQNRQLMAGSVYRNRRDLRTKTREFRIPCEKDSTAMVEHDLPALRASAPGEGKDAVVCRRGCLRLLSAPVSRVGDYSWKRPMRLQNKEKTMPH